MLFSIKSKNLYFLFITLILTNISVNKAQASELKVMVYNVENLFDTQHDFGKNDWAYTPKGTPGKIEACQKMRNPYYKKSCFKSDWTPAKLKLKYAQIKKVIYADNGKRPDILALVEVENENVIKGLAKVLNYDSMIVSNGPDKRGIDLAILYNSGSQIQKINVLEHELHRRASKKRPTRNILEVEMLIDRTHKLTIFVNHWPSLSNPTSTRLFAAKVLATRIKQIETQDKDHNIIALGDFNTIDSNYPHPFKSVLLKNKNLFDMKSLYRSNVTRNKIKNPGPMGTYFYAKNMAWNDLDRIFVNKRLIDGRGMDVMVNSYKVESYPFMTKTYHYNKKGYYSFGSKVTGVPNRYNFNTLKASSAGYSDHFPISLRLQF